MAAIQISSPAETGSADLQQYAGWLHRQQAGKTSVRIIDWLDLGHSVPQRMCERRLRGYRAVAYSLISDQ